MSKKNIIILVITIIMVAVIAFVAYYLFVDPNMFNPDNDLRQETNIQPKYDILKMSGQGKSKIANSEMNITASNLEYYVILNKEGKVIETLTKETFESEEVAKNVYNKSTLLYEPLHYNKKLNGKSITCNFSYWNGLTEAEVKNSIVHLNNIVYDNI